ncbi:hypothetical protein F5144DRAFT_503895 [Chaetomium tenue]|uniref:Uncharacterized protein n=1 Tax=Chaetomium tenue TaxID=1854479 RepID=A0ACB7PQA9_9PEZI|nr:hypothetical protein F5144DRAFT_503895 [Chaetomium globosum]
MSEQIVLFDIPTREPRTCWSLNPWKTRLLLNYKGLDYRTEWVEYPDIKPTLEPHVAPNAKGMPYTIPTIRQPNGTYTMDSRAIATVLEAAHPTPSLHLDSPVLAEIEGLVGAALGALLPVFLVRVPDVLLADASVPYWMETRKAFVGGLDVREFAAQADMEKVWGDWEKGVGKVTEVLKRTEGPFFAGGELGYVDFVWGGLLLFVKTQGEDVWEKAMERSGDRGAHERLLEGIAPWSKRNDH